LRSLGYIHIVGIQYDKKQQSYKAVLSHGVPRDAAVHFDTYRILQ